MADQPGLAQGEAVVTVTGVSTRIGAIARTLEQVRRPRTPFASGNEDLAGKLVWVAAFFAVLIPLIGIRQGYSPR